MQSSYVYFAKPEAYAAIITGLDSRLFGLDSQNPLSIAYIAYKNNISVNRAEELKEEGFMRLKENNIKRNDSHFLTL